MARRFALSMVQGFVVEPLVSVVAARGGYVLLPAGAFVAGGGAVILLGRSGAKTSIIARVPAAGGSALGDDQAWSMRRRGPPLGAAAARLPRPAADGA